jgi:hypothetical protein
MCSSVGNLVKYTTYSVLVLTLTLPKQHNKGAMEQQTTSNSKRRIIGIVAAIILVLCLVGVAALSRVANQQPKSSSAQTTTHQQATVISYTGQKGKTALELLKEKARVVTKTSQYGEYVDSINGLAGGKSGKYWSFYVNGKLSSVGAGSYTTQDGEAIVWKYE